MKYAVIELSQGGVETLIFDSEGNKLFRDRNVFSVPSYVEKGKLSKRGIEKLADTVAQCKEVCVANETDEIHTIAPKFKSIMENFDEVNAELQRITGLSFCSLSGKARAYYNYLAARNLSKGDFAVIETGGCGAQIVGITNDVVLACPLKLGSVKLSARFVSGVAPTQSEIEDMKEYIIKKLDKAMFDQHFSQVFLLGNVSQSIMQMCADYYKRKHDEEFLISKKELNTFFNYFLSCPNKVAIVLKYAPERLGTVSANILFLKCALKKLDAQTVSFRPIAVIDGYASAVLSGEYYGTDELGAEEEIAENPIENTAAEAPILEPEAVEIAPAAPEKPSEKRIAPVSKTAVKKPAVSAPKKTTTKKES